jgi:hypothetical protein
MTREVGLVAHLKGLKTEGRRWNSRIIYLGVGLGTFDQPRSPRYEELKPLT